jgi:UDP-N-acetylmuramoyl-tripeptide--D-alanyl-D-alanine ligase
MRERSAEQIAGWCRGEWHGTPPGVIDGVCHDSRCVQPGNLYVAIKGERFDGHNYLLEAQRAGAAAAMVSRDCEPPEKVNLPLLLVDDTRKGLSLMADGYRQTLDGLIIGISGSAGKTTVKEMVADILALDGPVAKTIGNWNNDLGLPLSLLSMEPSDKYGVFEIGINHPAEMKPLACIMSPRWGVLTSIGAAHIEFFCSEEHLAHEKAALFDVLPNDGLAFMDMDSKWYATIAAHAQCRHVTVSLENDEADLRGIAKDEGERLEFVSMRIGRRFSCRMPLPGEHIMRDALLATAVALELGIRNVDIQQGLENYKPLQMRWEREHVHGVEFINDAYNANPLSMRAAIDTFASLKTAGRKWLVLGGMRELGRHEHAEHIRLGGDVSHGDWAGVVAVGSLGMWLADGLIEEGFDADRIARSPSRTDAVHALIDFGVSAGDTVLLKASRNEKLEEIIPIFEREFAMK